ncbi:hypothetical protein HISP_16080 [Haloarcula hispanica N601]|uniref:Uncharacterized protein n=1 Tax=Haloarcula hispanica N601 TaxID=1417673 RepID=V5TSH1_HALHI|nr:hypothetical protein HISP_16080 [Haloarcula hispanica N601]
MVVFVEAADNLGFRGIHDAAPAWVEPL